MSLLDSSYIPMTSHLLNSNSTPGGDIHMEMLGNLWSDTDGALLGGCNNSFVASGLDHDCSPGPSSLDHMLQFPELEGEDQTGMNCNRQPSSGGFSMVDLLKICMTPDGSVDLPSPIYTYPSQQRQTVTGPSPMGLPKSIARAGDGAATGRWPASSPLQTPVLTVNCSKTGGASQLMVAGDSPGTLSPGWKQPVREMSGFVDLSDFPSTRLTSSRHLSAHGQQRASLISGEPPLQMSLSTAQRNNMIASTQETIDGRASPSFGMSSIGAKPPMNVEERLTNFPVTFVSVRQDLSTTIEQLHNPWTSDSFNSPKVTPDQTLNFSTNLTPEQQRTRKVPSHGEAVPSTSPPRKLQNVAPVLEPISAFEQVSMMQTNPQGVEGGYEFNSFLSPDASNVVFPPPKDLPKAGDHVARERRRRDLMNTRYQTLESLLPRLPCRRDRYGIVEDTKQYVKEMEQKLLDLKNIKASCQARLDEAKAEREGRGKKKASVAEPASAAKFCPLDDTDSVTSDDLNVEVLILQTDEEHDVVVFVRCRSSSACGAKLIGSVLRAIEKLQLDVSQCTTSKSSRFFFCNAVCKVQQHVVRSTLSREKMIQEMVTTLRPS